jgi:hypothetical protein
MSPTVRGNRRVQRVFATLLLIAGILVPITTSTTPAFAATPIADPGGPYSGAEGAAIAIDGSASSDPDLGGTIDTYAWSSVPAVSFADDAAETTTFTAPDNGTYTLTLTVTDNETDSHSADVTATVTNVDPVVDAGVDANAFTGVPFA